MTKSQFVFLIGGHDLEMLEICSILDKNNIKYLDHKLDWSNAKLSSYSNYLNDVDHFVGIELIEDIPLPANYIEIDHHNNNSGRPASILQIIDILRDKLNIIIEKSRRIDLISANDSGYIPAMEALNATPDEIKQIRESDRKAQGVTNEDEILAQESINKYLQIIRGVTVVNSLTTKFSAITDRLYPYSQLLIHTDNDLTYYGAGINKLALKYKDLIKSKKAYIGGGESGFFGINEKINKDHITNILKIIKMNPLSYHIFMFPFKFGSESGNYNENVDVIDKFIKQFSVKGNEKDRFEWDKPIDEPCEKYNQEKYFHEFAHPVLFEDEKQLIVSFEKKENKFYRIKINNKKNKDKKHYPLKLDIDDIEKDENDEKDEYDNVEIDLNIQKVTLDLNKHGVGIFSFHLEYHPGVEVKTEDLLNNVLLINQYGRRIYPPFLDTHYKDFEHKYKVLNSELDGTKHRVLPNEILILNEEKKIIVKGNEKKEIRSDWKCFNNVKNNECCLIPEHILYFLNIEKSKGFRDIFSFTYNKNKEKKEIANIRISPILDDRMFVMSWLGAYQLTNKFSKDKIRPFDEKRKYGYVLSDICHTNNASCKLNSSYQNNKTYSFGKSNSDIGYLNNDFWYMYVFADSSEKTCQNEIMQQKIIKTHTYDRWLNYKTLYGISRYSFVVLSTPIQYLKDNNASFITTHFKTIYFKMVTLVLIQRSLILKYSKDINETYTDESNKRNKVIDDYPNYLKFINKYLHREVSTQEQGIELYDMLIDHLRVEAQAKELEKEYQYLFSLKKIERNDSQRQMMKGFTIIGTAFAIPTLLNNFSNSSFFSNEKNWESTIIFLAVTFLSLSLILVGLLYRKEEKTNQSKPKRKLKLHHFLIILGIFIIIGYLVANKLGIISCNIASHTESICYNVL